MAAAAPAIELGVFVASLAIQYGLPALLQVLTEMKKVDPTMTDLETLKNIPIDPDAA